MHPPLAVPAHALAAAGITHPAHEPAASLCAVCASAACAAELPVCLFFLAVIRASLPSVYMYAGGREVAGCRSASVAVPCNGGRHGRGAWSGGNARGAGCRACSGMRGAASDRERAHPARDHLSPLLNPARASAGRPASQRTQQASIAYTQKILHPSESQPPACGVPHPGRTPAR